MNKPLFFKKDKYQAARGGYSRLISVHCQKCDAVIAKYQKDGPGNLRRLYMDRILAPNKLVGLEKKNLDDIPQLKCLKCSFIVAIPYIYSKENRKAFRVFQDALVKRIQKLN